MRNWLKCAMERGVVVRALKIALPVGLILAAINHGDALFSGRLDRIAVTKIALTFVVPYVVSTISSVAALRGAGAQKTAAGS